MKRYDFTSFDTYDESNVSGKHEAVVTIDENGWFRVDLMTECKRWKTAVRRFFAALGEDSRIEGWEECMKESAENDTYEGYERGEFAWGIEELDEGLYYVYLNVHYAEETTQAEESNEPKKVQIYGKRWFQRSYGNTYHRVNVVVNDTHTYTSDICYGYGRQFVQTAGDLLRDNGYCTTLNDLEIYNWLTQNAEIKVEDVPRRRDLTFA